MEKTNLLDSLSQPNSELYDWTLKSYNSLGLAQSTAHWVSTITVLAFSFLLLYLIYLLITAVFNSLLVKLIKKSRTLKDDVLLNNKVLDHLSRLFLLIVAQQMLPGIFIGSPEFSSFFVKGLSVLVVLGVYGLINSLLKAGRDLLRTSVAFVDKPLDSYLQVIQIFLVFVIVTLSVSLLTGHSPWDFLISLGAASAILMLVFKDTILGFVASIQVSANDSVRVGDWIEMPKFGVDGSVLQINLNNVKVQNFDKTIVTIPTYTLMSDSFKNYRGMQDSGGRRIKRSINIKISSIRYLTESEIQDLTRIELLRDFIEMREQEIKAFNQQKNIDESMLVNGRRMTNVGLFRAYMLAYAKNNSKIHSGMTLMVRQLAPTEHGLPLEAYFFTKGTEWVFFENTMSDIFDHYFAAIKYFHLEVFELPASDDLRRYMQPTDHH